MLKICGLLIGISVTHQFLIPCVGLAVEVVNSLIGDCTLVLELPPLQLSLNFTNISINKILTKNFIIKFPHKTRLILIIGIVFSLNKTKNEKTDLKVF